MLDTVKEDVTAEDDDAEEDDVAVDAPKDCLSVSGVRAVDVRQVCFRRNGRIDNLTNKELAPVERVIPIFLC